MKKNIAVGFDGVLCTDTYPKIGEPDCEMINELINSKRNGDKLILWTCRRGVYLAQAVKWCKNKGLEFDAINKNLPKSIKMYDGDTRKVFADIYIDDKFDYMAHLDKHAEFGDPLILKEWDKIDYKFHDNGYERVHPKSATFSYEKYNIENDYIHRIDIFVNDNGTYHIHSYQKSKNNNVFTYSVRLCDWQIELIKLKVDHHLEQLKKISKFKYVIRKIQAHRKSFI